MFIKLSISLFLVLFFISLSFAESKETKFGDGRDLLPSLDEIKEACNYIADTPHNKQRMDYLIKRGFLDINNDGKYEQVKISTEGSGLGYDEGIDTNIKIKYSGFEPKEFDWGFGKAWFIYKGKTWQVSLKDSEIASDSDDDYGLVALSYITPRNELYRVCNFKTKTDEVFYETEAKYRDFCGELGKIDIRLINKNFEYEHKGDNDNLNDTKIKFLFKPTNKEFLATKSDNEKYIFPRETRIIFFQDIDFNNDGKQDRLSYLQHSTGAGRGCDIEYYDICKKGKKCGHDRWGFNDVTEADGNRYLLRELQSNIDCANKSRKFFIKHQNKFYLASLDKVYAIDYKYPEFISILEDNEVKKVCSRKVNYADEIVKVERGILSQGD